ncbi:MAG TPA: nucleotidyltransferase [Candidatus Limnocylindrales bacterium]|nr:nucleotidyltransferase [Candidatus Limnocylindrales bacterium]
MEEFIAKSDWEVLRRVTCLAQERGLRFAVGGGFATSFYTAFWRNTKDLDLCVLPQDRDAMVQITKDAGFGDLHDEKPYDRGWIYRATVDGLIVDIIWQLANYRGEVDDGWLASGPEVSIHGDRLRLVPPEEMIWSKIHVVQRDRCDFPDIVNILYACGARMDWAGLLKRLDGEERLLASVVSLYTWLAPGQARTIPEWVWQKLGLPQPSDSLQRDDDRIRRIDSRPWFSPI